ncbi:hypothetical protein [Mucilaginibacter gilvus]|uniref:Uncharacterized protein n=1 Tax=Mucilaginibacter gilvus TaxID=2305909 RepID=A0A3S3VI25_9SPHI|nr:hypothetical protein [Mucilaginibacter gilvus]RWY53887.1 hypothetical protein EPL05_07430 [Mucilaginibacter gilvus]
MSELGTPQKIFFRQPGNSDVFSGILSLGSFKLTGEDGRNGFRPEATVQFVDVPEGTLCTITIIHQLPTFVFLIGAVAFVVIGACYTMIADIINSNFRVESLLVFCFLLLIYLISAMGFNIELPELKGFINKLLELDSTN